MIPGCSPLSTKIPKSSWSSLSRDLDFIAIFSETIALKLAYFNLQWSLCRLFSWLLVILKTRGLPLDFQAQKYVYFSTFLPKKITIIYHLVTWRVVSANYILSVICQQFCWLFKDNYYLLLPCCIITSFIIRASINQCWITRSIIITSSISNSYFIRSFAIISSQNFNVISKYHVRYYIWSTIKF